MPNDNDSKSDETKSSQLVIDLDGEQKVFTSEDVKNLIAQQASATQKTQTVSAILQAAERYKVTPEDFLHNAEGSFNVMNELIDRGIIDEQGNILDRQPSVKPESKPPTDLPKSDPVVPRADEVAMRGLVDPIMKRLDQLQRDNNILMRLRLQDSVMNKFDNLSESDMAELFVVAERDQRKSLIEHAADKSKAKAESTKQMELEFAKKHGINLDELQQKKLFEQDPEGGAAAIFSGKKMSFKRTKDAVSPLQATKEYFKKLGG